MRRIWLAATVLILGLGVLFLFLPRIVEALLIAGLERAAFPSPSLRVTDIGWRQATLADLRLGDGEASIDELVVTYSPVGLLRLQVNQIRLSGLRVAVRLDGEGLPFGSLDAPLAALGGGTENGTAPAMPDVILDDGRVAITTRLGEVVIPLEGAITTAPDGVMTGQFTIPAGAVGLPDVAARELAGGIRFAATPERISRVTGRFDLAGVVLANAAVEAVTLAVDLDDGSGSAHLTVVEGGDALDLEVEAIIDELYGMPDLSAEVEASATAASLLWPLIGLPPPIERRASLSGSISGRLSPATDHPAFAGSMEISVAADEATLDATLTNATFTGAPDAFSGTAHVALAAPEIEMPTVHATEIAFGADTAFAFANGTLTLHNRGDAQVRARRLVVPGILATTEPVRLPLQAAEEPALTLDFAAADGFHLAHALKAGPVHLRARLWPDSAVPLPVDLELQALSAPGSWSPTTGYRGTVALAGGEVLLPDRQIAATGAEADLLIGGPDVPSEAHLRVAKVTHRAEPALFAPMPARAEATLSGNRLTFTLQANAAAERAALTVNGQHDLQSGVGGAEVDLPPVAFAPDGLEPEDLAPILKGRIEQTTGTVALAGTLSWDAEGSASNLRMLLRDLSFTTPLAEVVRLNSVVRFDSLLPLSTPPGQKLAIGLIDAVLPLTDGIATFQLRRSGELVVSDGRLRLAGGEITVEPAVIDLDAPENRIELLVTDAALSELLALADIDGLSATGRLDGRIPVHIEEDVIIENGTLAADAPGRLSYDPVSPPAALQAQGETISLLLSALTNFEYHDLRLTVDREAGGEMLVSVHVAGKNPAFYDGYPVELNFNISGKLDQVLQRSLVGYRIPDAIRERLSEFPK
ncbi:intermembrane phospholipid transport protein YdbH family protein [Rhodospirillaceae bacterium SYSU D60014]|uniref:YdbH domain-containing protein n=1 Tax=Virgifigura deserti TaxID=2268457 RepID=UPI0013C45F7E